MTKKIERQFISQQLQKYGITSGPKGERFSDMDYYSLRNLLAIERIKRGHE